jgi:two-component system, cell cycle sensor histidine kinase and response regulator CckA
MPHLILLVENDDALTDQVRQAFQPAADRYQVAHVRTVGEARAALRRTPPHVILANLLLPDGRATDLLPEAPAAPLLVIAEPGQEAEALHVIQAGATDFLVRTPATLAVLPTVADGVLQRRRRVRERQDMEAALRVRNATLESLTQGVLIADARAPDLPVIYANPAFTRLTGYAADEVLGRNCRFLQGPDTDRATVAAIRAALREGLPFLGDVLNYRKDGTPFWNELALSPVRDEQGRLTHFIGIQTDATARIRAAAALRASEARTRGIINTAFDAIITIDEHGTIESVNPATERMFGYAADELLGHNVRVLMPEPYRREHDDYLERYRRTGERHLIGTQRELAALRKDGTVFPVHLSVGEIALEGRQVFTGIVHDLTVRKDLERQLFQSQKMEAIGVLAGGVAHDFNNLLTVIMGYADLLIATIPLEGTTGEALTMIKKTGERAAALTRQLLIFSRKQVLEPVVLDLNTIVRELSKMLRRMIGDDIELVTRLAPDLGRAKADPSQVEQVLLNLAVNARDAMPRGGSLTIETANADLDEAFTRPHPDLPPGPYVRLTMRDTGVGMDEATKARIFEPFFTTKELGKGTGLGLATVYGIVKQSGGHVAVESAPARGATFHVYLPRLEAAAAVAQAPPAFQVAGGTETLLLVEDQDDVRRLARMILEASGFRVLEAINGEDAVATYQRHAGAIDLLVTDVMMPRMNGPELAAALQAVQPGLRVLFVSGFASDAIVRRDVLERGLAFLQKPFTPTTLVRKVREVLDQAA